MLSVALLTPFVALNFLHCVQNLTPPYHVWQLQLQILLLAVHSRQLQTHCSLSAKQYNTSCSPSTNIFFSNNLNFSPTNTFPLDFFPLATALTGLRPRTRTNVHALLSRQPTCWHSFFEQIHLMVWNCFS